VVDAHGAYGAEKLLDVQLPGLEYLELHLNYWWWQERLCGW
jgi:hypothetical protein